MSVFIWNSCGAWKQMWNLYSWIFSVSSSHPLWPLKGFQYSSLSWMPSCWNKLNRDPESRTGKCQNILTAAELLLKTSPSSWLYVIKLKFLYLEKKKKTIPNQGLLTWLLKSFQPHFNKQVEYAQMTREFIKCSKSPICKLPSLKITI